ncbi:ATPase [Gordonia sp. TBRC 11910]|uniref:ATPase n=1 Tax=Gordonia asplenii TaxID=2725283 RepID=A0A848KNQ5_9ACTN|nr:SRPBCC domain-containing protein [Gordonia asplenii]NMN99861.1 ATPase [Gordonia asplenii]
MTDGSRVLVALRVAATAERAFTAFTEHIARWWQPNLIFQFTPGRTGVLAFEPLGPGGRLVEHYDDGTQFVIGQISVWEPPSRLVVGWRQAGFPPDADTELHVRFEQFDAEPVQTRVTVEHYGWDRIPAENVVRHGFPLSVFALRFAEWWKAQLKRLGESLD